MNANDEQATYKIAGAIQAFKSHDTAVKLLTRPLSAPVPKCSPGKHSNLVLRFLPCTTYTRSAFYLAKWSKDYLQIAQFENDSKYTGDHVDVDG